MKPMLSATLHDLDAVNFPVLCSPKLDGIRCLIIDGKAYSRNLKLIPNAFVQAQLRGISQPLDGELIVGSPTAEDCYRKTNSGVMSHDGEPDFTFWVFDMYSWSEGFADRLTGLRGYLKERKHKRIKMVEHASIGGPLGLAGYEEVLLKEGYEGVMGRSVDGPYKNGRATMREGSLWKLKRFVDGEATIIGFDEQLHNANEKTVDNLGRAKRSSHKENKHGKGTLGALKVQETVTGVHFDIGTGLTDAERQTIWNERDSWLGRTVKYKSLPIGVKEKPRHPVYLGERKDI